MELQQFRELQLKLLMIACLARILFLASVQCHEIIWLAWEKI